MRLVVPFALLAAAAAASSWEDIKNENAQLRRHLEEAQGGRVPVIVSYYDGKKFVDGIDSDYGRTVAVKASMNEGEISQLIEEDPFVESIDVDGDVSLAAEINSWDQFDAAIIGSNSIPEPNPADDPISVCLVDSGLMKDHEDFPYTETVIGTQFDLVDGATWDNPTRDGFHGTFMMNVMVAAQNGLGGVGVLPSASPNIRPMMCRAFNELDFAKISTVDACVEWCVNNGAKIVNLSLGTSVWNSNSGKLYFRLWQEGVLLVASSGNQDIEMPFYPAAYPSVIGVGSVKQLENGTWTKSDYSQYFSGLDLVTPGENIYSSSISMEVIDSSGVSTTLDYIGGSAITREDIVAELADCGDGSSVCDAVNKTCLMAFSVDALPSTSNNTSVSTMAQNCYLGGGVAAIIFDNENSEMPRYLTRPYASRIPVYSLSFEEGSALASSVGKEVTIDPHTSGYRTWHGTSISSAVVSGIAAKLWSVAPGCSNSQIREALESTATPIGDGSDSDVKKYGKGLVNADAAFEYLQGQPSPCGNSAAVVTGEPSQSFMFLWNQKVAPSRASKLKSTTLALGGIFEGYSSWGKGRRKLRGQVSRER